MNQNQKQTLVFPRRGHTISRWRYYPVVYTAIADRWQRSTRPTSTNDRKAATKLRRGFGHTGRSRHTSMYKAMKTLRYTSNEDTQRYVLCVKLAPDSEHVLADARPEYPVWATRVAPPPARPRTIKRHTHIPHGARRARRRRFAHGGARKTRSQNPVPTETGGGVESVRLPGIPRPAWHPWRNKNPMVERESEAGETSSDKNGSAEEARSEH